MPETVELKEILGGMQAQLQQLQHAQEELQQNMQLSVPQAQVPANPRRASAGPLRHATLIADDPCALTGTSSRAMGNFMKDLNQGLATYLSQIAAVHRVEFDNVELDIVWAEDGEPTLG